jgi:hypothetical protein
VTHGATRRDLVGIVDSGADATLLNRRIAAQLGISDTDLVEQPAMGGAAGNRFKVWTTRARVSCQVLAVQAGTLGPWGPRFALYPSFAEDGEVLLGRSDFFEQFVVTFDQKQTASFHLDC